MRRPLGVIACFAACSSPSGPSGPPVQSTVTAAVTVGGGCPPDWCAGNSPQIGFTGTKSLWELNLDNMPNAQGFTLIGISRSYKTPPPVAGLAPPPVAGPPSTRKIHFFHLEVTDSAFIATDPTRNMRYTGSDLKDYTIWLKQPPEPGEPPGPQQGERLFGVRIAAVGSVSELVAPGKPPAGLPAAVETYELRWGQVTQGPGLPAVVNPGDLVDEPQVSAGEPVCPIQSLQIDTGRSAPPREGRPIDTRWDASLEWDESTVLPPFNAVVFEGDRINASARTVNHSANDRWFNIGCPLQTLAKMRLTRNTLKTTNGGWQQVQATLKMLSADYCGHGTALTVAGTPITWQQAPVGTGMMYRESSKSIEARWDEYGALCLDVPRIARHPNSAFLDIESAIAKACVAARAGRKARGRPPRCPKVVVGEKITTANWSPPRPPVP